MLRLPLAWGASGLAVETNRAADGYNEMLITAAVTVERGFDHVSEVDWEPSGCPVPSMLGRNVTKDRLQELVYYVHRELVERCKISMRGVTATFEENTVRLNIEYTEGRYASLGL